MRAGEITRLRLEDIDWRAETLRIHHSKTGAHSLLPLMAPVGEALLNYLRRGRPKTDAREIFIRTRAPYRPLSRIYSEVRRRLEAAGVKPLAGAPQDPASGLFWQNQGAARYASQSIAWWFVDILRRTGLKPLRGKTGPRIHDLRHSMVVNRILAWYRAGINPQERLPYLATFLGHRDIHSTLVYITVTQDLLQQAGERFRTLGARCLQVTEGVQP
jgi:integrase